MGSPYPIKTQQDVNLALHLRPVYPPPSTYLVAVVGLVTRYQGEQSTEQGKKLHTSFQLRRQSYLEIIYTNYYLYKLLSLQKQVGINCRNKI